MWKRMVCALLCFTYPLENYAKAIRQIRQIEADESKVIEINTALGYSTIIEFDSKPNSAVLGDQDAFKLEYVGNSITVKPLISHAKSNLFIFTEYDRFNCTLRTGVPAEVDYIVKLRSPRRSFDETERSPSEAQATKQSVKKQAINKSTSIAGYSLRVSSIHRYDGNMPSRAATVIEIELSSKQDQYSFSVGAIGIEQNGKFLGIESLYLDALELKPNTNPIRGKIVLLNQEFSARRPFTVVFAVSTPRLRSKAHRLQVVIGSKKEKYHGKGR